MRPKLPNVLPSMREWAARHLPRPQPRRDANHRPVRRPKVFTPVTPDEAAAVKALAPGRISYPVASAHKRFARDVQGATELTDAQRRLLWTMVVRYRRQLLGDALVRVARARLAEMERSDDERLRQVVRAVQGG
jgi:hypothetical protein